MLAHGGLHMQGFCTLQAVHTWLKPLGAVTALGQLLLLHWGSCIGALRQLHWGIGSCIGAAVNASGSLEVPSVHCADHLQKRFT